MLFHLVPCGGEGVVPETAKRGDRVADRAGGGGVRPQGGWYNVPQLSWGRTCSRAPRCPEGGECGQEEGHKVVDWSTTPGVVWAALVGWELLFTAPAR